MECSPGVAWICVECVAVVWRPTTTHFTTNADIHTLHARHTYSLHTITPATPTLKPPHQHNDSDDDNDIMHSSLTRKCFRRHVALPISTSITIIALEHYVGLLISAATVRCSRVLERKSDTYHVHSDCSLRCQGGHNRKEHTHQWLQRRRSVTTPTTTVPWVPVAILAQG